MAKVIEKLIINSPYNEPTQHWAREEHSQEFILKEGRRRAGYFIADPRAKKATSFAVYKELALVNQIREQVAKWKAAGKPGITGVTEKLLNHWNSKKTVEERPFFFCQLEAIETIIFLNEAPSSYKTGINIVGDGGNFLRWCTKMATGSGKTIVMSMVIAYNILNKVTYKQDTRFSKDVLIIAPGLTVRSRLSVLHPTDKENYYEDFQVVPSTMMDKLRKGNIKIINWHKLQWQSDEQLAKKKSVDKRGALSETAYVHSILGDMAKRKNIIVINDEAHHAWRIPPEIKEKKSGLSKEQKEKSTVWVSGLDRIHNKVNILKCYDLSATPFASTGRKSQDENYFSWIISDFGLNDAIEAGMVKTPRIVIRDDGKVSSDYKSRLYHIYKDPDVNPDLQQKGIPENSELPDLLQNAYELLAQDWKATQKEWKKVNSKIPPAMITVANTTLVADRIKHHFLREDCSVTDLCNEDYVLKIDSSVLKSIEKEDGKLTGSKKKYAEELRAKVDSVGKIGEVGEQIRNVISVGMLSEGWDAKNVTHIMGLRAFTSQLLCEQVVGRGLRRVSYEFDEKGMLPAEYVNVFGVPFEFLPHEGTAGTPTPPKPKIAIEPKEEKNQFEIKFPNILRVNTIFQSN